MTIATQDRRRFQRVVTDKAVEVTIGLHRYRGLVADISLQGLLFRCDDGVLPAPDPDRLERIKSLCGTCPTP